MRRAHRLGLLRQRLLDLPGIGGAHQAGHFLAVHQEHERGPQLHAEGTAERAEEIYFRVGTSTLVPTAMRSAARSSDTAKVMSSRIFTFPATR